MSRGCERRTIRVEDKPLVPMSTSGASGIKSVRSDVESKIDVQTLYEVLTELYGLEA